MIKVTLAKVNQILFLIQVLFRSFWWAVFDWTGMPKECLLPAISFQPKYIGEIPISLFQRLSRFSILKYLSPRPPILRVLYALTSSRFAMQLHLPFFCASNVAMHRDRLKLECLSFAWPCNIAMLIVASSQVPLFSWTARSSPCRGKSCLRRR